MSPKQWLALFCFYLTYLFFGASIFYHIEHVLEAENRANDLQLRIDINELLTKYTAPNDTDTQNEILNRVSDYCGKKVTNYTMDTHVEPLTWSFYHALFFSFTVCSTVGYGNISPSNTTGRIFMIFYALIGIPVNGFLFAYLGDFFGKVFLTAYDRYKEYRLATTKNYVPEKLGLIAQIILYLIPGIVIFLFLPSLIFSYFEEWSYVESLYYSFVTLSTIGFGDFVPTFESEQEAKFGFMFHVYEVFIIFWFIFGLGYLVMIMGFIAKGLRSKHLTRLEHQLAENIKATHNRIWHGVTKDVSYLRRILNEVYMMKFKSVYDESTDVDAYHADRRSSSCPDLSIYRPASEQFARKRAHSVFCHVDDIDPTLHVAHIHRVQSDNTLNRKDRLATPDDASQRLRADDLIARVFNALGNIKVAEDEIQSISNYGFHGLSDSQILSSEQQDPRWSIPHSETSYAIPPAKHRSRAASDFRAPIKHKLFENKDHEWTWCGSDPQIAEFMRLKKLNDRKPKDLYRASFAAPPPFVINMEEPPQQPPSNGTPSLLKRINIFKGSTTASKAPIFTETSVRPNDNYLNQPTAGGFSRKPSIIERRPSTFSIFSATDENSANILENTTIADLIRALETMHTQAVTGSSLPGEMFNDGVREMNGVGFGGTLPSLSTLSPSHRLRDRRVSMLQFSPQQNTMLANRTLRRRSMFMENGSMRRRSSALAARQSPPPYTETLTPTVSHRRFSVRPTLLTVPPGQSTMPSVQVTSSLQRKISSRPAILFNDAAHRTMHHRFNRSISNSSSNYSLAPLDSSLQSRAHGNLLSPVDESQFNFPRQRRPSQPDSSTTTRRKRCESK